MTSVPIVSPDPIRVARTPLLERAMQEGHEYYLAGRPPQACIHAATDDYVRWDDMYRVLGYIEAMSVATGQNADGLRTLFDQHV